MKLLGKTASVTGGARGLGRAYVQRLASLGADVAIVDINLDGAAEFGEHLSATSVAAEVEQLGRRGLGIQAGPHAARQAFAAIETAHAAFGRTDILVNNAGGALTPAGRSLASVTPEEDTRLLMDVNFMSTAHCCQAVAPLMKRQGGGVIVNISSQSGITTYNQGLLRFTPLRRRRSPTTPATWPRSSGRTASAPTASRRV